MKTQTQTNTPELRFFDSKVELRAADDGTTGRTITGYAFLWDTMSSRIGGWFREKIHRDALNGVDIDKMDVTALFNHDNNLILARTSSGTLTLEADDKGLRYEFEAPDTTAGNDLLENVRLGNVKNSSFSFTIAPGGDVWEEDEELGDVRTIMKFKRIYDVSPVTVPAYPDTTVAARSYEEQKKVDDKDKPAPTFHRDMARRKFNLIFTK